MLARENNRFDDRALLKFAVFVEVAGPLAPAHDLASGKRCESRAGASYCCHARRTFHGRQQAPARRCARKRGPVIAGAVGLVRDVAYRFGSHPVIAARRSLRKPTGEADRRLQNSGSASGAAGAYRVTNALATANSRGASHRVDADSFGQLGERSASQPTRHALRRRLARRRSQALPAVGTSARAAASLRPRIRCARNKERPNRHGAGKCASRPRPPTQRAAASIWGRTITPAASCAATVAAPTLSAGKSMSISPSPLPRMRPRKVPDDAEASGMS